MCTASGAPSGTHEIYYNILKVSKFAVDKERVKNTWCTKFVLDLLSVEVGHTLQERTKYRCLSSTSDHLKYSVENRMGFKIDIYFLRTNM